MTNHALFTRSIKMADLISVNYALLTVLPRFGIKLGFAEGTVDTICQKSGVETNLFLMVCNTYTFAHYAPQTDKVDFSIDALVAYLLRSHEYYLNAKISSIEKKLYEISQTCLTEHRQVLINFFKEYKSEVVKHFAYEEQEVFPYIKNLGQGIDSNGYHIDRFEENHSNIEDKLGDLKNILIKYLHTDTSDQYQNSELLLDLFSFEQELRKHQLVEEQILIPFVERLEKELSR